MTFSTIDHMYMTLALRLAEEGLYSTQPNPRVGCVIVKNHQIIGQGTHLKAGEAHAEIHALLQAGKEAQDADVYITLEPCSHHGRTPPCMNALVAARVKRVVIAMQDPNPLVAGKGTAHLTSHGIHVELGLMEKEALALNIGFVSRMTLKKPYVRCKIAASIDGRTALQNGKSQWITSEAARLDVQNLRARSCAIITGIGTVLADNPRLTVRLDDANRQPLRVIVDSHLNTPTNARILNAPFNNQLSISALIAYADDPNKKLTNLESLGARCMHLPDHPISLSSRVNLNALIEALSKLEMNEVLIEAGQNLNGAFLHHQLVDELIVYLAPKIMGNEAKAMFALRSITNMQEAMDVTIQEVRQVGTDIRIVATPIKSIKHDS